LVRDRFGRQGVGVPEERLKVKDQGSHRVPLSPRVIAILEVMAAVRDEGNDLVFPSGRTGEAMSSNTPLDFVRRVLKRTDTDIHGFRSSARTWAGERTSFAWEICEVALAHKVGGKVARAYQRGDLLERRRKLMEAWSAFVAKPQETKAKVVELRQGAA
jgi:integrase